MVRQVHGPAMVTTPQDEDESHSDSSTNSLLFQEERLTDSEDVANFAFIGGNEDVG